MQVKNLMNTKNTVSHNYARNLYNYKTGQLSKQQLVDFTMKKHRVYLAIYYNYMFRLLLPWLQIL